MNEVNQYSFGFSIELEDFLLGNLFVYLLEIFLLKVEDNFLYAPAILIIKSWEEISGFEVCDLEIGQVLILFYSLDPLSNLKSLVEEDVFLGDQGDGVSLAHRHCTLGVYLEVLFLLILHSTPDSFQSLLWIVLFPCLHQLVVRMVGKVTHKQLMGLQRQLFRIVHLKNENVAIYIVHQFLYVLADFLVHFLGLGEELALIVLDLYLRVHDFQHQPERDVRNQHLLRVFNLLHLHCYILVDLARNLFEGNESLNGCGLDVARYLLIRKFIIESLRQNSLSLVKKLRGLVLPQFLQVTGPRDSHPLQFSHKLDAQLVEGAQKVQEGGVGPRTLLMQLAVAEEHNLGFVERQLVLVLEEDRGEVLLSDWDLLATQLQVVLQDQLVEIFHFRISQAVPLQLLTLEWALSLEVVLTHLPIEEGVDYPEVNLDELLHQRRNPLVYLLTARRGLLRPAQLLGRLWLLILGFYPEQTYRLQDLQARLGWRVEFLDFIYEPLYLQVLLVSLYAFPQFLQLFAESLWSIKELRINLAILLLLDDQTDLVYHYGQGVSLGFLNVNVFIHHIYALVIKFILFTADVNWVVRRQKKENVLFVVFPDDQIPFNLRNICFDEIIPWLRNQININTLFFDFLSFLIVLIGIIIAQNFLTQNVIFPIEVRSSEGVELLYELLQLITESQADIFVYSALPYPQKQGLVNLIICKYDFHDSYLHTSQVLCESTEKIISINLISGCFDLTTLYLMTRN